MKNCVTEVQHQKNKKYNSKINIPKILHLHFVDRTVIYSISMKIEVAFTALD